MRYRLIVFDWDGTVMDSTGLIAECIGRAADDLGLVRPTLRDAKHVIGLGLLPALQLLFPDVDDAMRHDFARKFREHYVPRDHEAPVYPGIPRLLERLRSDERFLAIATGKPRVGLDRALVASGLREHFHYSRCGDEGFAKPHPDMLERLMSYAGVPAKETLMIGDTTHDLNLAKNAGVDAVAVSYGAHPLDALRAAQSSSPALLIAESVDALHTWLEEHA
jgi:phosphoglycolate phosphatase